MEDRNSKKDLPTEKIYYILEQLHNSQTKTIVISGGEPFYRNDLADICKYAKSLGINTRIISNGTFSPEKYLEVIPHITELDISVDGYNEETSFIRDKGIMPKVLKTLMELKGKVPLHMIVTLHKKILSLCSNINYLQENLELHSISVY